MGLEAAGGADVAGVVVVEAVEYGVEIAWTAYVLASAVTDVVIVAREGEEEVAGRAEAATALLLKGGEKSVAVPSATAASRAASDYCSAAGCGEEQEALRPPEAPGEAGGGGAGEAEAAG